MKPHPHATIFPLLDGEELAALVADIKTNGLREKIWIYEGAILDGRNRYLACQRAHVTPDTREFRGTPEAALAFVISANLVRRHLTWDQRRAIAQQILPVQEEMAKVRQNNANPKGDSAPNGAQRVPPTKAATTTAKLVDVSPRTIERDKIVAKEVPALLHAVAAGKVAMNVAVAGAKLVADARKSAEEKILPPAEKKTAPPAKVEAARKAGVKAAQVVVERILDPKGTHKDPRVNVSSVIEEFKRADRKRLEANPRRVKVFLDEIRRFGKALVMAEKIASHGMFSPEAKRFVSRRLDDLIKSIERLRKGGLQ